MGKKRNNQRIKPLKTKKSGKTNWNEHKTGDKPANDPEIDLLGDEDEEEEEEEQFDCCDRCLFASFGFICLYLAMFVIFFSERDHKYSQRDVQFITSTLKELDIAAQSTSEFARTVDDIVENQYPLHFVDSISDDKRNMIVMDDRTDLSYPGVALKVFTEMFQWMEREEIVTLRSEGNTETKSVFSYHRNWSSTFHDSSNFNDKENYYNPQPTVSELKTRTIWVDDIVIGRNPNRQFHLSKSLYSRLSVRSRWKNVTAKAAEYSEMEGWEMRDGFLFRPYDKVESFYAKEEPADTASTAEGAPEDEDGGEAPPQRKRLKVPRTLIGDIRMTVIALDAGGETISYLGSVKAVGDSYSDDDQKQHFLIPWRSPTGHKFAMLRYGAVDSAAALREFGEENTVKLWLSRLGALLSMFVGFMVLPSVNNATVRMLSLPIGPIPFETWTAQIVGAAALSVILWTATVAIAYSVGFIHLALSLLGIIIVVLFFNNKTITGDAELEEESNQQTAKKEQ